ncbi:MAG: cytochrome c3 family protein [Desulfovermiculus sp.]
MFRSWRPSIIGGSVMCLIMVLALVAGISWATSNDRSEDHGPERIYIRSMQAFGELQFPPVLFEHDLHTEHLDQAGKGCETCHPQVNDRFVFTFSELEAASREEAKRIYHSQCVQCHRSEKNQGNTSGPLEGECRACHQEKQPGNASYASAGMNLALHAKHIESEYGDCGTCHHSYDPQSKELVPVTEDALG